MFDLNESANILDTALTAQETFIAQETNIRTLRQYTILNNLPILDFADGKKHLIVTVAENRDSILPLIEGTKLLDKKNIDTLLLYRVTLPGIGQISLYSDIQELQEERKFKYQLIRLNKLPETEFFGRKLLLDLSPIVYKARTKSYALVKTVNSNLNRLIGISRAEHKTLIVFLDQAYIPADRDEVKPAYRTYVRYLYNDFETVFDSYNNLLFVVRTPENSYRTYVVYTERGKPTINREQARVYLWTRFTSEYRKWLTHLKQVQPQLVTDDIDSYFEEEVDKIANTLEKTVTTQNEEIVEPVKLSVTDIELSEPEKRLLEKEEHETWVQKFVLPKVSRTLIENIGSNLIDTLAQYITKFVQLRPKLAKELYKQHGADAVVYAMLLDRGQTNNELYRLTKQFLATQERIGREEFNNVLKQLAYTKFELEQYAKPELARHYTTSFLSTLATIEHPVTAVNRRREKEMELLPYQIMIAGTLETKNGVYQVLSVEKIKEERSMTDVKYSYQTLYRIKILTPFKTIETVDVYMPDLIDGQYFIIGGHRKILMFQLINKPIAISKRHLARITTNYQVIRVEYKPKSHRFVVYIAGIKQLPPLGIILAARGINHFRDVLQIDYKCTDQELDTLEYPYRVQLKNGHLYLKPEISEYEVLVETFVKDPNFRKVFEKLTCADLEQPERIQDAILETYKFRRGREAESYRVALQKALDFIDPVTRLILIQEGIPPEPSIVLLKAALLAYKANKDPDHSLSLDQARIRWSEMLVEVMFKELSRAIRLYENDIQGGKKPGQQTSIQKYFNTDTVMNKLVVDTANQYKLPMLLQHAEYSSPLEELSTAFGVKLTGPDALKKEAIQPFHRDIHETWYGIISAVDTPENENIGIKNHLTISAVTDNVFGLYKLKDIDPEKDGANILSPIEVLIPFVENNDGNRVMLASNQMRSITPIRDNEPPAIQTGYEGVLPQLLSGLFVIRAKKNGKVIETGKNFVLIEYEDGTKEFVDVSPRVLKTGKGEFAVNVNVKVKKGDIVRANEIIAESEYLHDGVLALGTNVLVAVMDYMGYTHEDSFVISETLAQRLMTFRTETITIPLKTNYVVDTIVRPGQVVNPGTVILAYKLPIITDQTEQELEEELQDESIDIGDDLSDLFNFTADIERDSVVIRTKKGGIVESVEIYTNVDLTKYRRNFELLIPIYEQFKPHYDKYIDAYNKADIKSEPSYLIRTTKDALFTYRGKPYPVIIRIKIKTARLATYGDKMANRHGNKGTIGLILKDELMPRTEYGERIDMIISGLGVINRLNLGQILEGALGYISKHLVDVAQEYYKQAKEEGLRKLYREIYETLYDGNDGLKQKFLARINALTKADLKQLYQYINKYKHVPIIIPPFRSPSYKVAETNPNIIKENIEKLAAKFNVKLYQKLFLPQFNRYTDRPVQVVYMYWHKLEHVSEEVMHARSFGLISRVTKQAVRGKKKGGGLRVGEFDSWALIGHDVPNVLRELFFVNADDPDSFTEIYASIIKNGEAHLPEKPKNRPARELFEIFLHGQHIELI